MHAIGNIPGRDHGVRILFFVSDGARLSSNHAGDGIIVQGCGGSEEFPCLAFFVKEIAVVVGFCLNHAASHFDFGVVAELDAEPGILGKTGGFPDHVLQYIQEGIGRVKAATGQPGENA